MTGFPEFAYWVFSHGTWRGIVLGGLLLSYVLPALLDLLDWRRG